MYKDTGNGSFYVLTEAEYDMGIDPTDSVSEYDTDEEQDQDTETADDSEANEADNSSETDSEQDTPTTEPDADDEANQNIILTNLSTEEYNFNNMRCYRKFYNLYNKINDAKNSIFDNIVTKNENQRKLLSYVKNNLASMLTDINDYMLYRYSRNYETNVSMYLLFLKRYNTAIEIINNMVKQNLKDKE